MKTAMTTISVVLLLSTLVWVAVYLEFPEAPLKPRETALVVFLCTIATASAQYAWRRWQQRHGKETRATQK
jgi:hypothetical protein